MQQKKMLIACDHGGFLLKETLKEYLTQKGFTVVDYGTDSKESVNYPDYAKKLVRGIQKKVATKGILICTSGIGMSIAANRYSFIRAALVSNPELAHMARLHNNANVLVFGANYIKSKVAKQCVDEFLKTEFEGGRHSCRVQALGRMGK